MTEASKSPWRDMLIAAPPARLDPKRWDEPYTLHEAVEAFKRVALAHVGLLDSLS